MSDSDAEELHPLAILLWHAAEPERVRDPANLAAEIAAVVVDAAAAPSAVGEPPRSVAATGRGRRAALHGRT